MPGRDGDGTVCGMHPYPCPACGARADLTTGCSACHRPPDPEAARVTELNGTIAELTRQVERARLAYGEAVGLLNATIRERNELAQRVQARVRMVAPVPSPGGSMPGAQPIGASTPAPAPVAAPVAAPARPESSGKTVQNVLFLLGGLLLGSAAIVFTAVAWANFGVVGRAVILGVVTVLTLAVAPLAVLRRLTGTAETFAALGLLLVLLDGYAAWAVNLGGVTGTLSPTRYAGLVCATTATIALGYGRAIRLTGPGLAALALAQPVPPLLLAGTGLGPAGWAATLSALALADLAVVRWARGPRAIPVMAWMFAGVSGVVGAVLAGVAELLGNDLPGAARAGVALELVALLLVPAGLLAPRLPWLRHLAGAVVAFALFLAVGRVLAIAMPDLRMAPHAAEVLVLALVVRFLPDRIRTGPRIGVLIAAGLVATIPVLVALNESGATVAAAWGADLTGTAGRPMPVALALSTLAFAVLLPGRAISAAVVGSVLLAFILPRSASLTWWGPSIVDGVVAVPLALLAARARTGGRAALYGCAAAVLTLHAFGVGLSQPAVAAAVLAATFGLATLTAVVARRVVVGALATGVAFAVPAGLGAALAAAAGRQQQPFAVAGLVVSTAAVLALHRRLRGYARAAALAVPVAGLGVAAASLSTGWYVAVPVLCDVLVGVVVLPGLRREHREWYRPAHLFLSAPALLPPLITVLPAIWALLLAPYAWLSAIWSGRPAGTGLVPPHAAGLLPHGPVFGLGPAAVTLALLALGVAITARSRSRGLAEASTANVVPARHHGWWRDAIHAALWAAGPACLAVLAAAAALRAPWPTVAVLSLAFGIGAALLAALRPVPGLAALALPTVGAGLAGTLATEPSTLAGLVVVLITATVCAVTGRGQGARVAGWLVAVPTGALLAFAAARALDVTPTRIAFWVLAAAGAALVASAFPRAVAEKRAAEVAAHASAAAALLLTVGTIRYAAAVLGLWGIALGLRALWPGVPVPARRARIVAAVTCELVAYWLLLWTNGVGRRGRRCSPGGWPPVPDRSCTAGPRTVRPCWPGSGPAWRSC